MSGWRLAILLFLATLASTFYAGATREITSVADLLSGWQFAVPLMSILVAHEMGHYVAAKIHRVETSPPYFIPMPLIGLLGTMGAVIQMKGRIARRDALLDIGAAGPLAGMVVALPVLTYGLWVSPVQPMLEMPEGSFMEGRSILYLALLYATHGPIPEGHDIFLGPVAFAGWAGLLVTMMNLIPIGQLDGGHVAYALFGRRQGGYARWLLFALPFVAVLSGAYYVLDAWAGGASPSVALEQWSAGIHWLIWVGMISVIGRFAGRGAAGPRAGSLWNRMRSVVSEIVEGATEHPPTDDGTLSPGRRIVAIGTLLLFVVLFMPSWIREVG